MNTVFKVVRVTETGYRSAIMSERGTEETNLQYTPDHRTRAPRGSMGILVFDRLEAARDFRGILFPEWSLRILECSYAGKAIRLEYYPGIGAGTVFTKSSKLLHRHYRRATIVDWINCQWALAFHSLGSWHKAPEGTYSVESVVPFRVVD